MLSLKHEPHLKTKISTVFLIVVFASFSWNSEAKTSSKLSSVCLKRLYLIGTSANLITPLDSKQSYANSLDLTSL